MGRKSTVDKKVAIRLFKSGMTYITIAKKLDSNIDTIRMIIKRNAPEDLAERKKERKEEINKNRIKENKDDDIFVLEHGHILTLTDMKEMRDEKGNGILPNESIGDVGLFKMISQSYKDTQNHEKLVFDESRGKRTYAVPKYIKVKLF